MSPIQNKEIYARRMRERARIFAREARRVVIKEKKKKNKDDVLGVSFQL